MHHKELHNTIKDFERILREKGVANVDVCLRVNWLGSHFHLTVEARDRYKAGLPRWEYGKNYSCNSNDLEKTLNKAYRDIYNIPSTDQRYLEILIRELHKMAGYASAASAEGMYTTRERWDMLAKALLERAENLSHNGLPKPDDET